LSDSAGLFGCYLRFFQIPSPAEVRRALAAEGLGAPGSGLAGPSQILLAHAFELMMRGLKVRVDDVAGNGRGRYCSFAFLATS